MSKWRGVVVRLFVLLGVTAAGVVGVAPVPAQAYTPFECQTRTWTRSSEHPDNMTYYHTGGWWKWGRFTVSRCRDKISWEPEGYRYTRNGVVDVRVRTYNANGNTLDTTPWVTTVGGRPTVLLCTIGCRAGTTFSYELRVHTMPGEVPPTEWWPLGQGEF